MLVGRDGELRRIAEHLIQPGTRLGVQLHGKRGVGKSSIGLAFMERFAAHFPGGVHREQEQGYRGLFRELRQQRASLRGPVLVVVDDPWMGTIFEAGAVFNDEITALWYAGVDARVLLIRRRRFVLDGRWLAVRVPGLALKALGEIPLATVYGGDVEAVGQFARAAEGNPTVMNLLLGRALSGETPAHVLDRLAAGQLLQAPSEPASDGRSLSTRVREISDELLAGLVADPHGWYELTPRRFEEVVAEIYERQGYDVLLTPFHRDDGVDIYAVRYTSAGPLLTVVDCKRYAAERRVQVGVVRQLYGTVEAKNASAGVLATTSFFTRGALEFQQQRRYRIGLSDMFALQDAVRALNAP